MRTIRRDTQFKRDVKRMLKRNKDMKKLRDIISLLVKAERLPPKNKDHALKGTLKDCRECHIESDWLLLYRKREVNFAWYAQATIRTFSIRIVESVDSITPYKHYCFNTLVKVELPIKTRTPFSLSLRTERHYQTLIIHTFNDNIEAAL